MHPWINLMAPEVRANPYPVYASLRRTGPCQVAPGGMWAISRHADVIAVLADEDVEPTDGHVHSGGEPLTAQPAERGARPVGHRDDARG